MGPWPFSVKEHTFCIGLVINVYFVAVILCSSTQTADCPNAEWSLARLNPRKAILNRVKF